MLEMKEEPLRILIADDARTTIRAINLMLRQLSDVKVVAVAENGRQAIDLAKTHEPDIALVDINMPEINGFLAIKEMLRHRPEMVCIMMSVEGDIDVRREAESAGATDYLIKPFTTEELMSAIEKAGQRVMNLRPEKKETGLLRRKVTVPFRSGQTSELRQQHDVDLKQLATQYIKERRTDDEVIAVFEELATLPYCEMHWLQSLAIIYVKRKKWEKLGNLAERLKLYPE